MSDQPQAKTGRIAQIRQAYKAIRSLTPASAGGCSARRWRRGRHRRDRLRRRRLVRLVRRLMAIPSALLAAVIVMNRRGNTAMYRALEGQPGAAGATLTGLGKRGWYAAQEPVAIEGARGPAQRHGGCRDGLPGAGSPRRRAHRRGPFRRGSRSCSSRRRRSPGSPRACRCTCGSSATARARCRSRRCPAGCTRMRPGAQQAGDRGRQQAAEVAGRMKPPIPKGVDPTRARVDRKAMRGK